MSTENVSKEKKGNGVLAEVSGSLLKEEAIKFGRYIAHTYNTDAMIEEEIDNRIVEIYEEYLKFCGRQQ